LTNRCEYRDELSGSIRRVNFLISYPIISFYTPDLFCGIVYLWYIKSHCQQARLLSVKGSNNWP